MATDRAYKQLYFILFTPWALQAAYLNLYFERRGLAYDQIGVINAVSSLCGIFAPLVAGAWADRLPQRRHAVAVLAAGAGISFPLLWFSGQMAVLLPIAILLFICRSPLTPVTDALCLDYLASQGDPKGERYAPLRVWGSIGFVAIAATFPRLLADEATSDPLLRLWPVFVGFAVCSGLLVLRVLTLPPTPRTLPPADRPRLVTTVLEVLGIPRLKRLLLVLLLSEIANSTYYLWLSLYLDSIGVADRQKGDFWAMGVVAEIALMAFGTVVLRKLGVRRLLLYGLLGRLLRLLAFSRPLSPTVIFWVVQPSHALGFAAVHLATMAFLARTVPGRLRASGQAAVGGLVAGLGGVLGNLVGGAVSQAARAAATGPDAAAHGLYVSFGVAAGIQAVGLLLALLTLREPEEPQPVEAPGQVAAR